MDQTPFAKYHCTTHKGDPAKRAMVDDTSNETREAEARLAAAYLDMWEAIASAHALKGPSRSGNDQPTGDGKGDD